GSHRGPLSLPTRRSSDLLANELMVPLFVVRYEAVIGSFLGETGGRLKRLFDFVRTHQCVLFFDEFDTLGKERGDTHETGEIKRRSEEHTSELQSRENLVC